MLAAPLPLRSAASEGAHGSYGTHGSHDPYGAHGLHGAHSHEKKTARIAGATLLRVASGTPQSAIAFAASSAAGYETVFPAPLVVRVGGHGGNPKSLRFFCADAGCRFALSEQPDAVKRVDARTYEVPVDDGTATLSLTLSTDTPGTFTVIARPMDVRRVRGTAEAKFRLTAR